MFGAMNVIRGLRRSLAALPAHPQAARMIARALAGGEFADALRMLRTAGFQPDRRSEKMVSRKYNFVCICIPKVASRSLIVALSNVDADIETFNLTIEELFAARPETERYFVFSFVRHPYTRALSLYQEIFPSQAIMDGKQQGTIHAYDGLGETHDGKRRRLVRAYHGLGETRNFDDYCDWLNTFLAADAFAERHFLSQYAHTRIRGDRTPNFIGRFEDLDADLSAVAEHLDMPKPVMPMLNSMAGWRATPEAISKARTAANAELTDRNKALLRRRYARDFALGNYDC